MVHIYYRLDLDFQSKWIVLTSFELHSDVLLSVSTLFEETWGISLPVGILCWKIRNRYVNIFPDYSWKQLLPENWNSVIELCIKTFSSTFILMSMDCSWDIEVEWSFLHWDLPIPFLYGLVWITGIALGRRNHYI